MIASISVYDAMGILPLRLTFQHSSAIILYNIVKLDSVPALRPLFSFVTSGCTRRSLNTSSLLQIPFVRTESAKQNFAYWGAKLWNSIPEPIRNTDCISSFANSYGTYLRSRLPQALDTSYDILDFL